MLALSRPVAEPVWLMIAARLPPRPPDTHPLGCHRRRVSDLVCFHGIVARLITGCSWDVAGVMSGSSESTLRRRFREWTDAGVFDAAVEEALAAYDTVIGFRLDNVAVDASQHKAPTGGEAAGPNLWDRAKLGWKWSLLTDAAGIPLGWSIDAANRPDAKMLPATLDDVERRGLLTEIELIHLDKGYSYQPVRDQCARRNLNIEVPERRNRSRTGQGRFAKGQRRYRSQRSVKFRPERHRWQIERTNSWLTNFGQLRRNTDRRLTDRAAQLALAIVFIITTKLVKHAKRYNAITRRPY
jgi:transposase